MVRNLLKTYGLYFLVIYIGVLFLLITFLSGKQITILPGDVVIENAAVSLYFPLGTALGLTLGILVLLKFFRVLK